MHQSGFVRESEVRKELFMPRQLDVAIRNASRQASIFVSRKTISTTLV